MHTLVLGRKLILLGVVTSVVGIVLNLSGVQLLKLTRSFTVEDVNATLSIAITLIGLFVAFVGSLIWARVAPVSHLVPWGLPVGIAAFVIVKFLDVSIQGSTAMLVPVFYVAVLSSALILLIAAVRFVLSRRQRIQ